jgi:type I restriction enzyme S subunit
VSAEPWDEVELGEVVTLQRGFDLPSRERHDGAVPIVSSSGVTGFHDEAKIAPPGVVTGRYGTLGQVFYVKQPFWPLNTTLYVKDFHGNDPRFCFYFLQYQSLATQESASAVPGINRNVLHRLPVRRPPLEIQRKIASVLSAYDELIENNRRRIELLEEMAQRVYREWFVDFRYPAQQHAPLVDSPIGAIPEGWHVRMLAEVVDVNARTLRSLDDFTTIEYIDISSVREGSIRERKLLTIAEAPGRARRLVRDSDVIWSTVRPNLRSYALIADPPPNCVASTGFAVLTAVGIPVSYLYASSRTDAFVEYLVNHATGAAYPAVTGRTFEGMPLLVPSSDVLDKYAAIAEPAFRLGARLRAQSEVLRLSRNLLLPGLISGEIDVDHLDIAVEEAAA